MSTNESQRLACQTEKARRISKASVTNLMEYILLILSLSLYVSNQ